MFHGSMVALVTPMKDSGEIDFDALRQLVDWHIEAGTDAIVAAGTTGEAGTLSNKEKLDLIRVVVEHVAERIPVIAGTAANETKKAIELTHEAMEAGADACLIMTPAYIKPTQEGLFQHYKAIAEAVALPQILYNVPSRTACDLLPETLARLSSISNIIGVKEATGSMNRVMAIKEVCNEALDIYSGDDGTAKDLLFLGGKGVISVAANIVPAKMKALCQAAMSQEKETANALNRELNTLFDELFVESNPIPTKWALSRMGKIPAGIRLPLTPLSDHYHDRLHQTLKQIGVLS